VFKELQEQESKVKQVFKALKVRQAFKVKPEQVFKVKLVLLDQQAPPGVIRELQV